MVTILENIVSNEIVASQAGFATADSRKKEVGRQCRKSTGALKQEGFHQNLGSMGMPKIDSHSDPAALPPAAPPPSGSLSSSWIQALPSWQRSSLDMRFASVRGVS
jgi:hypothetical protein